VRGQHDAALELLGFERIPHVAFGLGVHARAGFVQKEHVWVADHGHRHHEFAFVAPTLLPCQQIAVHAQIHDVQQ